MVSLAKYMRRTGKIKPWCEKGYCRFIGRGGAEERFWIDDNFELQRVAYRAFDHPKLGRRYVYFLREKK